MIKFNKSILFPTSCASHNIYSLLHFLNKKRGTFRRICPSLRLPQRYKHTYDRNVPCFIHGHSDYKNVFALRLICEVVVQRWTFTISLPNFLFSFCFFVYTSIVCRKCNTHSVLIIIYHAERKNTRTKIQKDMIFYQKCRLMNALPQ